MKEERYKYFDDEELEALIEEVERSGMIAPPVYLKELIMEEAVHVGQPVGKPSGIAGRTVHCGECNGGASGRNAIGKMIACLGGKCPGEVSD